MPRVSLKHGLFATLVLLGSIVALHTGFADPIAQNGDQRQAVSSGIELERTRKWLDAIEHYENSVKVFPESKELEYGLRRAKIHFAIERRYSDSSFSKSLLSMSKLEAMSLLEELLTKIQGHYVDPVTATSFIAHGTESLYLALADLRFLEANVPAHLHSQAAQLRRTLRDEYWNKQIANRDSARALVLRICELADSQLQLSSVPVIMEYVFGGCNALDDYSSYLTPSRLNDLYGNIEGQFVGLGIEMKSELGKGLLLVHVLPESPAAEGGLMAGEYIVSVDGNDTRNMTTDQAAGLLQGVEGSRVSLEVQRGVDGGLRKLSLARRAVIVKSIPIAKIVDADYGIGYIQMNGFQKSSAQELDAALEELRRQGMRALIWDVRGNPGGLLTSAVEVLDRFIAQGVLVSTRGRTSDQNWSYSAHRANTLDIPLVLLIDGDSASASEIVAGAIKDHQRGTIVGRQSYGKWSVQSIFPVRNSTGLRLTTAKFYSPHGHTLSKIGVAPDIEVPQSSKQQVVFRSPTDIDAQSDGDIAKGVEVLRRQMASR